MGLGLNSPDLCKDNATQVGVTQSLVWDPHQPGDLCVDKDKDDPVPKLSIKIGGGFSMLGKLRTLAFVMCTPGLGDQKMLTGYLKIEFHWSYFNSIQSLESL